MDVISIFPKNNSNEICIDTNLIITFNKKPILNNKGFIRIYDYDTDKLVDELDLSIPFGPTSPRNNPQAKYMYNYQYKDEYITNKNTKAGSLSMEYKNSPDNYQLTIIGGFKEGFHFYPVIIKDNKALIQLHHNLLEYNHKYYVLIDKEVFIDFNGFNDKNEFCFCTKKNNVLGNEITVDKSTGDFYTVQGAIDSIPNFSKDKYYINIKNGDYEELVYFRNKSNIIISGENRDKVLIHYANNEVFNPHPEYIKTNERKNTFPSRRAAFAIDNCHNIVMKNLTVKTDLHGQAEGLLVNGYNNYFENIHIIGSGDALQTNGSAYYKNCIIDGEGDTILGRGPTYFENTILNSYRAFMWIRNNKDNHGNVFINCTFNGLDNNAVICRLPDNKGINYPDSECVLINCILNNIPAIGYNPIDEAAKTANILEYNSKDIYGNNIDLSKRNSVTRILTDNDIDIINKYMDYKYVLGEDFEI
ncbi:MAG: pectinesterase family protein [Anaeroplasmataceae bacterium]